MDTSDVPSSLHTSPFGLPLFTNRKARRRQEGMLPKAQRRLSRLDRALRLHAVHEHEGSLFGIDDAGVRYVAVKLGLDYMEVRGAAYACRNQMRAERDREG